MGLALLHHAEAGAAASSLTAEELAWMEKHPVIRVAATVDWPPFEFVDGEGKYRGINADILRHVAEWAGFTIEPVTGMWPELYPMLLNGELDLSPGMQASPTRREHLLFTRPFLNFPHAIYHHRDRGGFDGMASLAGKRVAVEKDYYEHEYLREHHPEVVLVPVPNALQALLEVASGKADAYIGNVAVADYLIDQNVLTSLRVGPIMEMGKLELSMGVRKDYGPLVSIIEKGIATMSPQDRRAILARYTVAPQLVVLSAEEYAWIREHPVIRLGIDPEFAPFEYIDKDGAYRGLASDYIRLLNERLGIHMEVVPNISWDEAVARMGAGALDVLPCVGVSDDRRGYMEFSEPYLSFHRVIITRLDSPFTGTLDDLAGQRVGVQRDSSHHAFLLAEGGTEPVTFETFNDTLLAVAQGDLNWAVGNAATATYWMKRLGLTNLRLAVPLGGELETLHFGIRKDWPELVSILNKGLASITEEEASTIRRRWMDVEMSPGIDFARVRRIILILLAILLPLMLLLAAHNRRLKREIRSRELAEASLRESESEYRTLVESANSIILRMSPDGIVTFLNAFGQRFLEFPGAELLGKSVLGAIHPDTGVAREHLRFLREQLTQRREQLTVLETENITKSGRPVRIAWTHCGLFDDEGALAEILGVGNDVTAQWEASESLRRYEFIINTVNEMMSIINRQGCYEAVNDEWCTATGLSREKVLGNSVATVWPEASVAEAILPRLERCFAGETVAYETRLELSGRGTRFCYITMYPFANQERATTHAIVVAQDITARKENEAALQRAMAEAQAGTRAKSAFLANMSHEIRTPLNAVLGYTQLLQRLPGLSGDQLHALNAIRNSGDHLLALISDILEVSRIEAGHVELNPVSFDVRHLLADLELMFKVKTDAKGISLTIEASENLPELVKADRNRINQVLINLLGNALKFTDTGGITLRASCETLPGAAELRLIFEAEDTGCGIAPEAHETVFGVFEQSGETAMRQGGAGLGLAISKNFARLMGGSLTLRSTPGVGSCFHFELIAAPGNKQESRSHEPARRVKCVSANQPEPRVLVVDDRETNRDLLCRMLGNLGFTVRDACNGKEALEVFAQWKPRILLIDLIMPVMGGRETIRRLRAMPDGKEVAVIVLTASTMGDDKGDILAEGADDFLRKPFREDDLLQAIHEHGHVEFEYDDGAMDVDLAVLTVAAAHAAAAALPAGLARQLQSVIMRGAIGEAKTLAAEIALHHPGLGKLILQRAGDYRLNELQSLWNEGAAP
jgi:polar amino acid transport system substrate-binding protein